jgi:hypothetical protein
MFSPSMTRSHKAVTLGSGTICPVHPISKCCGCAPRFETRTIPARAANCSGSTNVGLAAQRRAADVDDTLIAPILIRVNHDPFINLRGSWRPRTRLPFWPMTLCRFRRWRTYASSSGLQTPAVNAE